MGLVLTLGGAEKDFYVNDTQVELVKLKSHDHFIIKVNKFKFNQPYSFTFEITSDKFTEILPNVLVCAGIDNKHTQSSNYAKVIIEAPKSIKLIRGTNYRDNKLAA